MSDVYVDFISLISIRRGQNENMRNLEAQFAAQVSRSIHIMLGNFPMPSSLMLLSHSNIDDNQCVPILAAAVSIVVSANTKEPTIDEILSSVTYASIASVLR